MRRLLISSKREEANSLRSEIEARVLSRDGGGDDLKTPAAAATDAIGFFFLLLLRMLDFGGDGDGGDAIGNGDFRLFIFFFILVGGERGRMSVSSFFKKKIRIYESVKE